VETATVRGLPGGGLAYYVRMPRGTRVAKHFSDSRRDLFFIEGDAQLFDESGLLMAPTERGRFLSIPARTVTEIYCGSRAECLLFVRSVGPPSMHFVPAK
jgi:hypothetical protein